MGRAKTDAGGENAIRELRAKVLKLEHTVKALSAARQDAELARDDYRDLYEFAPIGALTLTPAYIIVRFNACACELLGADAERLCQQSFRSFVAHEERASFTRCLGQAAAQAGAYSCRVHLVRANGVRVPVQIWARYSPVRNLSELRLVDLREQAAIDLEVRRLAEAERALREENTAKDNFIAVLSHELRAPLTPVLAAASSLRARAASEDLQNIFEMIERNVTAEARLIDDLLDVNRIVRNRLQIECSARDVHAIALEALDTLRSEADAKQQTLSVELGAEQRHASVDHGRLRQVFVNLLKNAIKFTPVGGRIRLRSWNGAGTLALEVEDDGIGIDPLGIDSLFEAFRREDAQPGGGLGLGLTISKGLVELQGGRIAAHSRGRGLGSRFVVELPLVAPVSTIPPPPESDRLSEPPSSATERGPARVLLVDDHPDTIEVLRELLTANGFVIVAADSVQAAKAIDLAAVDLIVSDIGLPDGNGLDLMRELRDRYEGPAIALSGFGMESDRRLSEEAGFDLHLTKPVSIERLLKAIQSLRGRRHEVNRERAPGPAR